MENKGYFSKVYLCRLISVPSVSSNKRYFPLPSTEERRHLYKWKLVTFTKGHWCPDFWQKQRRVIPTSAASQLPLGRNNPYAKVAYFGVVYYNALSFLRGNQSSSTPVKILVPKLLCSAVSSLMCLLKKFYGQISLGNAGLNKVKCDFFSSKSSQNL